MKGILFMVSQMDSDLKLMGYTDLTSVFNTEKALTCVINTWAKVQEYIVQNDFQTEEDEIQFFKKVRPGLASKISFFSFLIRYQNSIAISEEMKDGVVSDMRCHFRSIVNENKNCIYRLKRNNSEDDIRFFTRNYKGVPNNSLGYVALSNPKFSTFNSLLLELLQTNKMIENFIAQIENKPTTQLSYLTWTDSKTDLIELMYSLHFKKSFNNGKVSIKDLANAFEQMFNVDLGSYYRVFHDIKDRMEPTKYLDLLQSGLQSKIDENEGFNPD